MKNTNIEVPVYLTIPAEEFLNANIDSAVELYESELKWDTEVYYRAVYLKFPALESAAALAVAKFDYFKKLIEAHPEYIYFLNEAQFKEVFHVLFVDQRIEDILERTQETLKLIDFEKYALSKQFKQFILESLEDMPTFYEAPTYLVQTVINEVKKN